jgi:hypothetical protein
LVITVAMILSPSFIAAMELDMVSKVAMIARGDLFAEVARIDNVAKIARGDLFAEVARIDNVAKIARGDLFAEVASWAPELVMLGDS